MEIQENRARTISVMSSVKEPLSSNLELLRALPEQQRPLQGKRLTGKTGPSVDNLGKAEEKTRKTLEKPKEPPRKNM